MHPRLLVVVVLLGACCTAPAAAAVKYIDSSPDLSALITGTNEFPPGQDATISILIQNSGLNMFKIANSGTIERDDLPNTAKLVTVRLYPGTAPITVRTDPQMVKDIPGGGTARATIAVTIADDAAAGEYVLPLLVRYRYLETTRQEGSDTMQFVYKEVNQTLPLPIRIRPLLRISVLEVLPESLNAGTEGYLHVRIRNDGSEDGKMATFRITRSGKSPIIPLDSGVFIGDFPPGGIAVCTCRAAVSADAAEQTYPIAISVQYTDHEGTTRTSETVTAGVPIGGKARFVIVSPPVQLEAGKKGVIDITYRNSGGMTVYNTQARIEVVPPFVSNDDTAFLGDMKPGEAATARYGLSVPEGTDPGEYNLVSEVRYRDALDTSQIAGRITVALTVNPPSAPKTPLSDPGVLSVAAAGSIGAGYYLVVMRKKK